MIAAGLIYEFGSDAPITDEGHRFFVLGDEDRGILAAIVPVMLAGALPAGIAAVRDVVEGLDTAISGLTPSVQKDVAQLFMLLRFPLARMAATGVMHPWHEASASEIDGFLSRWRSSPVSKLRSAYDALHQLIMASWYGNSASWARIGYPGPPVLR